MERCWMWLMKSLDALLLMLQAAARFGMRVSIFALARARPLAAASGLILERPSTLSLRIPRLDPTLKFA